MKYENLVSYYQKRGFSKEQGEKAGQAVAELDLWLTRQSLSWDTLNTDQLKDYLQYLVEKKQNSEERLIALARFFYITEDVRNAPRLYRYFTSILGRQDLYDAIAERVEKVAGSEIRQQAFKDIKAPPAGTPPEAVVETTARLMKQLTETMPQQKCNHALAGNAHRIPKEAFEKEPDRLKELGSLDAYLKDFHSRQVATLEEHARTGKVWFEQIITPEVVEYVRTHPEVLGGMRDGSKIYVTKIPYVADKWIEEQDPQKRRYLACHCPLAREAVRNGPADIPREWCYCSGGFAKFRFDVLFDQETEVELIETVLDGGNVCRFAVTIPEEYRDL